MRGPDCPQWCASNHAVEEAYGQDPHTITEMVHATGSSPVPVVLLLRTSDGSKTMEAESLDVVLFQHQFLGERTAETEEEWVFLGNDYGAFTMTRESANRVYRLLGRVLASGT